MPQIESVADVLFRRGMTLLNRRPVGHDRKIVDLRGSLTTGPDTARATAQRQLIFMNRFRRVRIGPRDGDDQLFVLDRDPAALDAAGSPKDGCRSQPLRPRLQ